MSRRQNRLRQAAESHKHATKTVKTDGGIIIVDEGAEITDAVYQKARLATKLGELAQNIQ